VPFQYNAEQAYILEFGDSYVRFYANGGIVTTAPQAITGITQANPAVVTYSGADTFANGDRIAITGVAGMTEVNNREFVVANVNITANTFELSGINSTSFGAYVSGGSVADIIEVATPYTAAQVASLSFAQSADTLFIAHPAHPLYVLVRNSATSWTLSQRQLTRGPWLSLFNDNQISIKANSQLGTTTLQSSSAVFNAGQVGSLFKLYSPARANGETEFGSPTPVNAEEFWSYNGNVYNIIAEVSSDGRPALNSGFYTPPTHKQGSVRLYGAGVGNDFYIDVNFLHQGYGIVSITGYTSPTVVTGTVFRGFGYAELPLQLVDPSMAGGVSVNERYREPTLFWQEGALSSYRGYAENVTFFEQRLMLSKTQTVFGSVSGDFTNFDEGAEDDRALNYTIASEQVDIIRWMNPGKQLLIGTTSGEYVMAASSLGEAVTPKNIKISRESSYGSSPCNPVRVGSAVLFMQRRGDPDNPGRKMREMAYSFEIDSFVSNDLTIFSPHITGNGVTALSYQSDPDALIWGVRTDGSMCCITYERSQEVTPWHRHILGGTNAAVESIATIPGANGDELWLKVRRTISGQTVRYVEVLSYFDNQTAKADGVFVDSAITYAGASTSTITGLWHLRGETVKYLAGDAFGTATVSATGVLTLPSAATKVHIGSGYAGKLKTLDFEAGAAGGSSQARQKRISAATLRLDRSLGGALGAEGLVDPVDYSDQPNPNALFSGDRTVTMRTGWGSKNNVYVEHADPLPFTVLGIIAEVNVTG
jgi:hypothetical protein